MRYLVYLSLVARLFKPLFGITIIYLRLVILFSTIAIFPLARMTKRPDGVGITMESLPHCRGKGKCIRKSVLLICTEHTHNVSLVRKTTRSRKTPTIRSMSETFAIR